MAETSDESLDALLTLHADLHSDPVNVFEDLIAAHLSLRRHPGLDHATWRRVRVVFIKAADERPRRRAC